jgi:mannose-6-phosphate isomerase-like protein (cupin superfamily)
LLLNAGMARFQRILFLVFMAISVGSIRAETPDFSGPDRGTLDVVNIDKQAWATADDHAVARQIVSPSNSRARKVSIADIIVPPGVTIREHHHAVIEEIYYITSGKGIMWLNGATRHVGVGDAIVIRPGEHHSIQNPYKTDLRMIVTCTPAWTPDCLIFDK